MRIASRYSKIALLSAAAPLVLSLNSASAQHKAPNIAPPGASEAAVEAELVATPAEPLAAALQAAIMDDTLERYLDGEVSPAAIATLRGVYAQTIFKPLWTESAAQSLVDTKKNLFDYGLAPDDLGIDGLKKTVETRFNSEDAAAVADADLELTTAWVIMANAVSGGLSDEGEAISSQTRPSRAILSVALRDAAKDGTTNSLDVFEPDHPQYRGLKSALSDYRDLADAGGWLAIPSGETIEAGDIDARIPALRERLEIEGFSAARPVSDLVELTDEVTEVVSATTDTEEALIETVAEYDQTFDDGLVDALKAFQLAHGLEADGVLGPNTLTALNESVESKIDRIADTMTRWRRHGDMGLRYIWANIPSYRAEAWNEGAREMQMKTIVGLPSRETPVFSDMVEYVVANPKWYAPVSIVRRDKLPKLAKDPNYAARGGYQIFDRETGAQVSASSVDWTDVSSARKYRLVQSAGAKNALGELKIIFPNQYSVYLHGTPNKSLFDEAQRAFSSGCIRLEDPAAMAKWLSRHDPDITPQEVETALAEDDTERLNLEETTPVHITYMTVTIDDEGRPQFWRDIYDRDDGIEMVKKLAPKYQRPESIMGEQPS